VERQVAQVEEQKRGMKEAVVMQPEQMERLAQVLEELALREVVLEWVLVLLDVQEVPEQVL
jgi:hypothetical protein